MGCCGCEIDLVNLGKKELSKKLSNVLQNRSSQRYLKGFMSKKKLSKMLQNKLTINFLICV